MLSMKRKIATLLCLCASLALTGCSLVDYPELTEEETNLVTEYAAGLVLKYDTSISSGSLLKDSDLEKEEAKEAERRAKEEAYKAAAEKYLANSSKAKSESDSSSSEQAAVAETAPEVSNPSSFYGMDEFQVSYTGYSLTESYPEDGRDDFFMALDATDGNQLCVVKFNVVNTSAEEADFDMFSKNGSFYIVIDGNNKVYSQPTLLLDDMSTYKGKLAPGEYNEMVLIFEVPDGTTSIGSMSLTMKNGDSKGTMKLF